MPDISLCQQKECPNADKCYRFTETPAESGAPCFQPEYHAGPHGVKCDYFISNEGHTRLTDEKKIK